MVAARAAERLEQARARRRAGARRRGGEALRAASSYSATFSGQCALQQQPLVVSRRVAPPAHQVVRHESESRRAPPGG